MRARIVRVLALVALFAGAVTTPAVAENGHGRIEGRVTAEDGRGYGAVSVVIHETSASTLTDDAGRFSFARVPAGSYTLLFLHAGQTATKPGIVVTAGSTTTADLASEWDITFVETLTVYSASRQQERVVEAPAAVTVVGEEKIGREASHGQLPKLLEFTPGVEVTQSGLYDYNFNTRGSNSSLNRRVATLIDGRNPSVPFLGAQEWSAVSFPLDDVANLELVRGPSAALYGANASSGVLNITSKQPRYSEGGILRVIGGELSTLNADFRYAGGLGKDWYFKVTAGARDTGDFSVSRNGAAEYSRPCDPDADPPVVTDCLPQEPLPLDPEDDDQIFFGSIRFDKYMDVERGGVLTLEAGTADIEGPVTQTGIGRVQLQDVKRPWGRINYSMDHWNFLAYYTGRDGDKQTAMSSGANLVLDTNRYGGEVQTHWNFAGDMARIVGGASYTREEIDSLDPATGMQTLMFKPVDSDARALFGQLDWQVANKVKLVFAARWDGSSLHDDQFSPKGSLVYSIDPNHTLRLTYNEAFQVANYSEFFLQADVAEPADTSALEGICLLSSVTDCGLAGPTRVFGLGNDDLEVEEIKTFEIGYSGIISGKTFVTLDYYNNENENFITDLIPNLGTSLGRINPDFGPWVGSEAAETTAVNPTLGFPAGFTVADAIRISAPLLSNNFDGSNIVAAVSYTNFGDVDTQGADLGIQHFVGGRASLSFAYSWFDFDIKESTPELEQILLPNSPERSWRAGFSFVGDAFDWSLSARWVDDFRWVVGPFQGDVEAYMTVDATGNYAIDDHWKVGFNIANLYDEAHWESFGGDLLGRRALAHLTYAW